MAAVVSPTKKSIKMEFIGSCIIKNGSIDPTDEQEKIGDDNEVYEVLRIEGGRPLFVNDHLDRWRSSMSAVCAKLPDWTMSFGQLIDWLIVCNSMPNCDMRIVSSSNGTIQCGYVETRYPTADMYANGVDVEFLKAEREQPKLKIFHSEMRSEAQSQQDSTGTYESLLVNRDGCVTEGSRSNVYFIAADGSVHTAGDDSVLGGIMRKHVMDICKTRNIKVVFECPTTESLACYKSAFLSSTPMRILPIRSIGSLKFDVANQVLRTLMEEMERVVAAQIKK